MWKGLSVFTDSPSPIVVVLSGSMEPAFQRGDLLFLWNRNIIQETDVGEIVVYNVQGKDIPIVHRIVRKYGTGSVQPLLLSPGSRPRMLTSASTYRPKAQLLTKGDNNAADDTELYARGQDYLERKDIIGSVGMIPTVARGIPCNRLRTQHRMDPLTCCSGIYPFRRLRDDYVVRASLDEDGHAGHHGSTGCYTTRIKASQMQCSVIFFSARLLWCFNIYDQFRLWSQYRLHGEGFTMQARTISHSAMEPIKPIQFSRSGEWSIP